MLSVYSIIRPPKYGNCSVNEKEIKNVINISDLKLIYKKCRSKTSSALEELKKTLDHIIKTEEWEAHHVIEHDYSRASAIDCIIYYVTGSKMKLTLLFF